MIGQITEVVLAALRLAMSAVVLGPIINSTTHLCNPQSNKNDGVLNRSREKEDDLTGLYRRSGFIIVET